MPVFIEGLAFSALARDVDAPGWPGPIRLRPYQILLWVSISQRGLEELAAETPRVPALLDTGNNHNFTLVEAHLQQSGLESPFPWSSLPLRVRDVSGTEWHIQRLCIDLWLHSNRPDLEGRPYPLRFGNRGAACFPASGPTKGPHLPLLGLAGLCAGSLGVEMHCNPAGGTLNLSVPTLPQ